MKYLCVFYCLLAHTRASFTGRGFLPVGVAFCFPSPHGDVVQSKRASVFLPRPLPRRPALSPYSRPVWTPGAHLGSPAAFTGGHRHLRPGTTNRDLCLQPRSLLCKHERVQADGRPVSPGCHHHPAAQDMEEQVLCR